MNRSRALGVWLLLCCAAAWLSLRPARVLSPAFESGFSPLRACADLATPLLVACGGGLRADASDARRTLIEGVKSSDVRRALARAAEPLDPALRERRHLVPAEVLQRSRDKRDVLAVRVPGEAIGIDVGDPVVCGDVYVGRVCSIDNFAQGRVSVEMVTDPVHGAGAIAIGADGAPLARLVIGGLHAHSGARASDEPQRLALALSSTRELVDGAAVRMASGAPPLHEHEALVDGFRVGRLRAQSDGSWAVETELDYENGLSQVCILVPESTPRGEEGVSEHALADGRWIATRALSLGDPGGVRSGFLIAAGAQDGIESGAVVWSRGALVGRVESVSRWSSRVRRLDDAGCSILAVASVIGRAEPVVLGRIVSRGEGDGGGVRMRWLRPRVLGGERALVEADLYTGSGELGLPSGLALGRALLPADGSDEIVIVPPERAGLDIDPIDIWVRQTAAGEIAR